VVCENAELEVSEYKGDEAQRFFRCRRMQSSKVGREVLGKKNYILSLLDF
jgi:hypothetical protein